MDDMADPDGSPASSTGESTGGAEVSAPVVGDAAGTVANGSEGTVGEGPVEPPIADEVSERPFEEFLLPDSLPFWPATQPESELDLDEVAEPKTEPNQPESVDGNGTGEPVDSETMLACLKLKVQAKQMNLILVDSLVLPLSQSVLLLYFHILLYLRVS